MNYIKIIIALNYNFLIILKLFNITLFRVLQLEKEDAINELDLHKDKIEKCQKAMYEAIQDKNGAKDELDRVMEKYDR